MKAVVYDAPRSYTVKDIPTPEAGAGEVRIKVDQVGVCGTDLHIHEGDFNAVFPLIPGHELVGVVDQVGAGVTRDRKSTRLNSSHANISYAVFCLKKKKYLNPAPRRRN